MRVGRSFHILDALPYPFRLVDERVIDIPAGSRLVTRNRDFKLVGFYEGRFTMEIKGVGTFRIRPGDFVVVPAACVQTYHPEDARKISRMHVFRVIFAGKKAAGEAVAAPVDVTAIFRTFPAVRFFEDGLRTAVGRQFERIFSEIENGAPAYRAAVHGHLLQMLAEVVRMGTASSGGGDVSEGLSRADQIVSQAEAYLDDHFDHPLKLSEVAWHLRISEEHLARCFQLRTGSTVLDAVRERRIEKGRRLLIGGNETLSAIARTCGFRSLAVFSVNFKAVTGLGPGTYRRLNSAKIVSGRSTFG